jgi:hypothetical protein
MREQRRICQDELCKRAHMSAHAADKPVDLIAGTETGYVTCDGLYDPRHVGPKYRRQRGTNREALADFRVDLVDGRRKDFHEHFARCDLRLGNILEAKVFRPTERG